VTVFFDATAVVALHIESALRPVAAHALAGVDSAVCVSALSLTESLATIDRLTDEPTVRLDLEDALRLQWDRYAVVPVDQRCLDQAAALLREQPIRLADAIQLAAAERLPRPIRYVTFDPVQIPVALGLGFDVISN
jgi:predicted nucleic acid-binding protein